MNRHKPNIRWTPEDWQFPLSVSLAIFGLLAMVFPYTDVSFLVAIIVITITIGFLLLILWELGLPHDAEKKGFFLGIPKKLSAAVMAFSFFLALVAAYAALYLNLDCVTSTGPAREHLASSGDAFYFSLVTITTVGYGDFAPIGIGRGVASCELLSGLLLLIIMIPILASRFADIAKPPRYDLTIKFDSNGIGNISAQIPSDMDLAKDESFKLTLTGIVRQRPPEKP